MLAATKRKRGPDSDDLNIEEVARGLLAEQESEVYKQQFENLEDCYDGEGDMGYGSDEEEKMQQLGLDKEEMCKQNTFLNRVSNLKQDLKTARKVIKLLLQEDNKQIPENGDLEAFKDFQRKEEKNENAGTKLLLSQALRNERKNGRFGLDDAFFKSNEA